MFPIKLNPGEINTNPNQPADKLPQTFENVLETAILFLSEDLITDK